MLPANVIPESIAFLGGAAASLLLAMYPENSFPAGTAILGGKIQLYFFS